MPPIPFNKPFIAGMELWNIAQAVAFGNIAGDGHFTKKCSSFLEQSHSIHRVLMTPSCTAALEMAAVVTNLGPGDEVILPSFTFVSTANAIVRQGAQPVFIDIRPDTLNINEELIEKAITGRTRAIVPVHYAGVGSEMDIIVSIAKKRGLWVIEDAAQGVNASYKNRPLGSIGHLGTFSFHETKNYICGEGGAFCINDPQFEARSEIIRDKGTNRQQFLRGHVDKYTWVDVGSSYVPSEICCAFLAAQFDELESISARRKALYERYSAGLADLESKDLLRLPIIPPECESNYHMFYVVLPTQEIRDDLMRYLNSNGVSAVFHYIPLHSSPMGKKLGYAEASLPVTEDMSGRLLRLPLFYDLSSEDQDRVVVLCHDYFARTNSSQAIARQERKLSLPHNAEMTLSEAAPKNVAAKTPIHQKTLLVLGAGLNQVDLIKRAKLRRLQVVAIDPRNDSIGFEFADHYTVADIGDYPTVLATAKEFQIDGVLTGAADFPVPTVARLCRDLNLHGVSENSAIQCTNKHAMRVMLIHAGVKCPEFERVTSFDQMMASVQRFETNMVVKPETSSGGRGVSFLGSNASIAEMRKAFCRASAVSQTPAVLVEEYVEGPEFSVEALTWNGVPHIIAITDKMNIGKPYFVEMAHSQPTRLDAGNQEAVFQTAIEAIRALGIDWSASHVELKLTADGPKVIEVGARLGGGFITSHLVPLSTGIDLLDATISVALGEQPDVTQTRSIGSAVGFVSSEKGILRSIRGLAEAGALPGVVEVRADVSPGHVVQELVDNGGRVGYLIAEAPTAEEAVSIIATGQSLIHFEVTREDDAQVFTPTAVKPLLSRN